jgi:hypothetical protein
MVTFKCVEIDCPQENIEINFTGDITEAECGGCQTILTSFDLTDDPELPPTILDPVVKVKTTAKK